MGLPVPKQYLRLGAATMLELTAQALAQDPRIGRIAIVVAADDDRWRELSFPPQVEVLAVGGATRAETVRNGLAALGAQDHDWVLVHDAARPCLSRAELARLIDELVDDAVGGLLAVPLADTLKRGEGRRVAATIDRQGLWRAATPQMFRAGVLAQALAGDVAAITDEASAIERAGLAPRLVEGEATNLKVTLPADEALARAILQLQGRLS
ncbi:MAG: 2-C-methyl-D-erythritol 4-phosphate cytidylyltransferase [Burkholderiaceae bacterium]